MPMPNSWPALFIFCLLFILLLFLYPIAIIQILKSNKSWESKILWILLIAFFPLVGLILYFVIGRKK